MAGWWVVLPLSEDCRAEPPPLHPGRADRDIWQGTLQRQGSKGYEPWDRRQQGWGLGEIFAPDLFQKGRDQL